jgi:peroxiredoxin
MTEPIKEGDTIPEFTFFHLNEDGAPTPITTKDVFENKKVVLFAVPGAFTPGTVLLSSKYPHILIHILIFLSNVLSTCILSQLLSRFLLSRCSYRMFEMTFAHFLMFHF